jgi:hypothetical protein
MSDKANIHWEATEKRRRILPFRELARDAAFIWRMCEVRYKGMTDSNHVKGVIEDNLAASRKHRFPHQPETTQ